MHKAVFLDRDGTLNQEVHYLSRAEQFHFMDGAIQAVRRLNQADWKIVVVTNQSGIARGYLNEAQLKQVHDFMLRNAKRAGIVIDAVKYCPHHPVEGDSKYRKVCNCRKPKPGMLEQAAKELEIDLRVSWMVGDRSTDLEAGRAAGCRTILVRTGYGRQAEANLSSTTVYPDVIADHLLDAVQHVIAP